MANLAETEFRTVIEDARARHGAIVGLIYSTDSQAMGLLRLYVPLGIAAASGAAAGFVPSLAPWVARPLSLALAGVTIIMIIGAALCLWAMRATVISLPGRQADFWKWALLPEVDRSTVLAAYLDNLQEKIVRNRALNVKTATAMKWAKRCGAAAPFAALAIGTAAVYLPA